MKFVQITAGAHSVFALDEIGRVWVCQQSMESSWRWLGWQLLGDVPEQEEKSDA